MSDPNAFYLDPAESAVEVEEAPPASETVLPEAESPEAAPGEAEGTQAEGEAPAATDDAAGALGAAEGGDSDDE